MDSDLEIKREKNRDKTRRWRLRHPEEDKACRKRFYDNNKEKCLLTNKKYRECHREHMRELSLKNYYDNKEEKNRCARKYKKDNYSKILENNCKYQKEKRKNDPQFNAMCRLRYRVVRALKDYTETGKIMSSKKYGIDYGAIIEHLKPFPEDLGKYHIDHIKPLCSFDLTNPEEIKKAFAPENHQWLLKEENLKKGGKERKSKKIETTKFL